MPIFDFKKERRDLYQPTLAPAIVEVPAMQFLTVDGTGDPNESPAYVQAVELLYGLSYALRMNRAQEGYFPFVVAPLEGLWRFSGGAAFLPDGAVADKSQLVWRMMIRQPGFVTPQGLEAARQSFAKKKPGLAADLAVLRSVSEGLCVQALHLGPYDTEAATIAAMNRYREQRGFHSGLSNERLHHEIYLGSPKTCAPEKLKTILRLPIRRR